MLNGVSDIAADLNTIQDNKPVRSFDEYLEEQEDEKAENEGNKLMQAYRLTGLSKVDGVCEFIETLTDNGAKFLVFAHHMCMLDALE